VLRTSLSSRGYEVRSANDGESGLDLFAAWQPDLVVTDLSMPNMSGIELCRALRAKSQVPIIVLSVKGEERTKIEALDAGADDYVTKPFSINELLARIRAGLRRSSQTKQPELPDIIEVGDFRIDRQKRIVTVSGKEVHLTPKEFDLLAYMASKPDQVLRQPHAAQRRVGRAECGAAGISAGIHQSAQEEDRAWRNSTLHPDRTLDRIPLSTRKKLAAPVLRFDELFQTAGCFERLKCALEVGIVAACEVLMSVPYQPISSLRVQHSSIRGNINCFFHLDCLNQ